MILSYGFKSSIRLDHFSILLNFSMFLDKSSRIYGIMRKQPDVVILSIGWLVVQAVRAIFRYFQNKLDVNQPDNLIARRRLTQLNMIEKVLIVTAVIVFTGIALMSFETVKGLGMSLLASAGVLGIVVGLAAQRSVGQILSGVQIAITQPIRLDDVVVIEGEWGRIEEINITYAVVKIWDERRLIVPIDYFLNNPIQNWTRTSSNILGTVFLYVSYDLPLDPLREKLAAIVKSDPNWDGRVQNIQVIDRKMVQRDPCAGKQRELLKKLGFTRVGPREAYRFYQRELSGIVRKDFHNR